MKIAPPIHRPKTKLILGVNIDHVATVREARGGKNPDVLRAALDAIKGGADGITVHLREDRRHIQDHDVWALRKKIKVPLNLEMSIASEVVAIALKLGPEKVCLVPERRQELTTEGGLDARKFQARLKQLVPLLHKKHIQVSLFINPDFAQVQAASRVQADAVEIHTGAYAHASGAARSRELKKIYDAALMAYSLGLHVHAGHGLDYENVGAIAAIPFIEELNIGHSIVSEALFSGLCESVAEMKKRMRNARL